MILALIGLILSFGGSVYLVFDTLKNFGKPKSVTSIIYKGENNPPECIRYKRQKGGWLKEVKITPEERTLVISLSLLSLGFLFQILDFLPNILKEYLLIIGLPFLLSCVIYHCLQRWLHEMSHYWACHKYKIMCKKPKFNFFHPFRKGETYLDDKEEKQLKELPINQRREVFIAGLRNGLLLFLLVFIILIIFISFGVKTVQNKIYSILLLGFVVLYLITSWFCNSVSKDGDVQRFWRGN